MRTMVIMLLLTAGSFAQDTIPAGTILPVQLNSSLRSNRASAGDLIGARVMQDVPLPGGLRIHAGARVIGHVVSATPASNGKGAEISLRFDTLVSGKRRWPLTTNLRALATMMDVSEAQIPESGPDRGTSEYSWTTDQIGGEVDYRGGGAIVHAAEIVGHSVPNGVLVRVSSEPGTKCRGEVYGNDRPQALWVFSSDACGLYDFPDVTLAHAGRTPPFGEITLQSNKGNVNIRAGSGMLLRVNGIAPRILPKNLESAAAWYRKAAEQGYRAAKLKLAALYLKASDYRQARLWCDDAAVKDKLPGGYYCLGYLSQRGLGMDRNLKEAFGWYEQGARAGDAASM
jgi:hypothetical protein